MRNKAQWIEAAVNDLYSSVRLNFNSEFNGTWNCIVEKVNLLIK
jgi:hypothetical protein